MCFCGSGKGYRECLQPEQVFVNNDVLQGREQEIEQFWVNVQMGPHLSFAIPV